MAKSTLILGFGKPKGESEEGGDDLMKDESHAAAAALRSALKGGNPSEIVDAFKAMLEACDDSYGDESAESDEPEEDDGF